MPTRQTSASLGACQWWDIPVQLVVGQTASKNQFVPQRNHTASRIVVCCVVTPLNLLGVPQSFERKYCLHLQGEWERCEAVRYRQCCESQWDCRRLMIYIVRQSGTTGGLCLRCPVGLPVAYDVHSEAQFDCFKSRIGCVCVRPSGTTAGL